MKDTYKEMLVELRRTLSCYFIATGVDSRFYYDSYRSGLIDRKIIVKFRKFMTNGAVIKPGYNHQNINIKEGYYCDFDSYIGCNYYSYYPDIFPRFYYKRPELVDRKEHGGDLRTNHIFGKFAFTLNNDGSVHFFEDNNSTHYDVHHDLYKTTLEELVQKIPECSRIMEIIKAHCVHPMKRTIDRTHTFGSELTLNVLNRQYSRILSEIKDLV
jgi:hypothetical protein